MHPHTGYYPLSQDHLADLRHQAQCIALARAARCARRTRAHQPSHPEPVLPAVARQALAGLDARHR